VKNPYLPPIEVLDELIVFREGLVFIVRQKLYAEYPPETMIAACNVIREYVEMGLRAGGES
jgi:hypothetical protein